MLSELIREKMLEENFGMEGKCEVAARYDGKGTRSIYSNQLSFIDEKSSFIDENDADATVYIRDCSKANMYHYDHLNNSLTQIEKDPQFVCLAEEETEREKRYAEREKAEKRKKKEMRQVGKRVLLGLTPVFLMVSIFIAGKISSGFQNLMEKSAYYSSFIALSPWILICGAGFLVYQILRVNKGDYHA